MLSWILHHAGRRPNFLIGGVAENFGRSFGLGGGNEFVLEGDEYDSAFFDKAPKFLHYHPHEVIITSLEFDHADIYDESCRHRAAIPAHGESGAAAAGESWPGAKAKRFAALCKKHFALSRRTASRPAWIGSRATWKFTDGETRFRVSHQGKEVARVRMALAGRHNVLNARRGHRHRARPRRRAAKPSKDAMAEFRGVLRRLEVKGESSGVLVVDDFAHHPTAIRATIDAARHRWPGRKLWAVFEPRSNTMRRKVFEDDLAASLATADAAVLGAVNRANLLERRGANVSRARSAKRSAPRGERRRDLIPPRRLPNYLAARNAARRSGAGDVQRQL